MAVVRYAYLVRSIPAWAGETQARLRREGGATVYPRVGGGNSAG